MKKIVSVLCSVAIVLTLAGCGIFNDELKRNQHIFSADRIETIYVEDNSHDVKIGVSKDGSIRAECLESATKTYSFREGQALQIKAPNYSGISNAFDLEDDFILLIPADYTGEIFVDTASGDIDIGALTPSSVRITSASGDVSLCDTLVSGYVDILTASGDVELDSTRSDSVTVETSSGDVAINGVYSDSFSVSTASGDVGGVFPGKAELYAIVSETSSGTTTLPKRTENDGIPLEVTTSSGNINITFALEYQLEVD